MADLGWLLLLFVTATNPLRSHGAVHAPPARTTTAVVGAVAVTLAGALLAGLSTPIAEGLRLTAPSVRLSAGIVAVAGGVLALVTPPPSVAAPAGTVRAGLVPVTVPLLLRPEVGVLAVSAGIDHGAVPTATALAIAAMVAAVASVRPGAAGALASGLAGAARLLAAVLVLVGVSLGIDGALAV